MERKGKHSSDTFFHAEQESQCLGNCPHSFLAPSKQPVNLDPDGGNTCSSCWEDCTVGWMEQKSQTFQYCLVTNAKCIWTIHWYSFSMTNIMHKNLADRKWCIFFSPPTLFLSLPSHFRSSAKPIFSRMSTKQIE